MAIGAWCITRFGTYPVWDFWHKPGGHPVWDVPNRVALKMRVSLLLLLSNCYFPPIKNIYSALLKRPAGIDRQDGWDRKISGRVLQTQTSFSSRKSSLKSAQKG
jgi:hypothetical protein